MLSSVGFRTGARVTRLGARSVVVASRRPLASSSNNNNNNNVEPEKVEYVHPLSQIVLEHLQGEHSDWIKEKGLERGLDIHRDGTFELKFPSPSPQQPWMDNNTPVKNDRIWTSYEAEEKKHYLTVQRGNTVGRFMLQDNMMPAWHSDKRSIPDRIREAVDQMIHKIDTDDGYVQTTHNSNTGPNNKPEK
mmetsp:Transcript_22257/g.31010  ORF Transcript_22257/g.31010 Transcript_22257/m.31010 type:complete len:190 (+) Transcript_22257:125-694(+)